MAPTDMYALLNVCEGCGGDGGGHDYDGNWHECRGCDGEGIVFHDASPVDMAEADELERSQSVTERAWGEMWGAWAENIMEQIGGE